MKREIVKVQLPIASSDPEARAFIYNKDKSRMGIVPITDELKQLLNGQLKSFWWAVYDRKTTTFEIVDPAPWQSW